MQQSLPHLSKDRLTIRYDYLANGYQPYLQDGHRTHTIAEAVAAPNDTHVEICGRICTIRRDAKAQIFEVEDESGKIQIRMTAHDTEQFANLDNFHTGDFIRAQGITILLNKQQIVLVDTCEMLTKTLCPLPGHDILGNENERYLAWIRNGNLRKVFRQRHWINSSIREMLDAEGYLEATTPTLQSYHGSRLTRSFTTQFVSSNDAELYLKTSSASYLKRMIVGGFERVYEISKIFRNEPITDYNNAEVTMLECYAAYTDYKDMRMLIQRLYQDAAIAATGTDIIPYDFGPHDTTRSTHSSRVELNFRRSWQCLTVHEAIRKYFGIDITSLSDVELQEVIARVKGIPINISDMKYKPFIRGLKIIELFQVIESNFTQPTFIIDFPRDTTAFCKRHRTNPELVERLEVYIAGVRVGGAYTELNDPVLQRDFMEDECADKPYPIDEELVKALEYGMPPTSSVWLNLDYMTMFLTNACNIRDVILFPTMPQV